MGHLALAELEDGGSGWGKAGWVLLIFIIPLIGILIYLIARPAGVEGGGMLSRE